MKQPSSVLFDLDGTLSDPADGIVRCILYAFERLGRPAPDRNALLKWIGPPLLQSFREHLTAGLAQQALKHYRERFSDCGMYENTLYHGARESLAALRARSVRLFVVTSKPVAFAVPIAEHFGITEYFDGIYGSELDGARSDKTELIAHVLERESIHGDAATMVGDRRYDVDGAHGNGLQAVGALWGYGTEAELAHADARCRSIGDVPGVLTEF